MLAALGVLLAVVVQLALQVHHPRFRTAGFPRHGRLQGVGSLGGLGQLALQLLRFAL